MTNALSTLKPEPILTPNPNRWVYVVDPRYRELDALANKQHGVFWTKDEIDFKADYNDWTNKLDNDTRYFIKMVLAFFAASDGIVTENLCVRFMQDVQIPEARKFYCAQMDIEMVHSEVYSGFLQEYVQDERERDNLFKAIQTIPAIKKKADWAVKWIESSTSFAERLVGFAAVEGIFFSGSFCSIFWLKNKGLLLGLSFSNELISRDEGIHCEFACALFKLLQNKPSSDQVKEILKGAVECEVEFIRDALPVRLIGMNADLMTQYIKFTADRLYRQLGYDGYLYGAAITNPFPFMEQISARSVTNFFEKKSSQYEKEKGDRMMETTSFKAARDHYDVLLLR
jgi:ribonucleoside-diphosphate reductase subunit M2